MSGIDVMCGDFSGGDKSCSALSGVAIGLREHLGNDAAVVEAFARLEALIAAPLNEFEITHVDAALLQPSVQAYRDELCAQLGNLAPEEGPDFDFDAGLNQVQAKSGAGNGWRYLCLHDLCRALEASARLSLAVQFSRW